MYIGYILRHIYKKGNICVFFPAYQAGVYSTRKEFAPIGSKFFSFRVDPISEGREIFYDMVASPCNCVHGHEGIMLLNFLQFAMFSCCVVIIVLCG